MTTQRKGLAVFILSKSPLPAKGRYGKREWQDWYRACVAAARIFRSRDDALILMFSGFKSRGEESELECYREVLCMLGIPATRMVLVSEEVETVNQLHRASRYVGENNLELLIVHTFTHAARVLYICWKDKIPAIFATVSGIPRPKEVLTDALLAFLFPILDLLHLRAWFLRKLTARRQSGIL